MSAPRSRPEVFRHRFAGLSRSRAAEVGEDGLTEVHADGWRGTIPWERITEVRPGIGGVIFAAFGGRFAIDTRYREWRRLIALIRQKSAEARAARSDDPVSPELIAEWLGIEPDGALICHDRHAPTPADIAVVVFVALAAVASAVFMRNPGLPPGQTPPTFLVAIGLVSSLSALILLIRQLLIGDELVRADAHSLAVRDVGRWWTGSWAQVAPADEASSGPIRVSVRGRSFVIADSVTRYERLRFALQRVSAARRLGRTLPNEEPVPASAISRMKADEPAVERGLSVTRGEE